MTLYMQNTKESTLKIHLLNLINQFIKVSEDNINIQKVIVFLYTGHEHFEKIILKEIIQFSRVSKRRR